uniref:Uncharacterized protein n=1 Tax=Serinus canaria TaxID=9135 RepID=A0A8C9UEB2_SERCA
PGGREGTGMEGGEGKGQSEEEEEEEGKGAEGRWGEGSEGRKVQRDHRQEGGHAGAAEFPFPASLLLGSRGTRDPSSSWHEIPAPGRNPDSAQNTAEGNQENAKINEAVASAGSILGSAGAGEGLCAQLSEWDGILEDPQAERERLCVCRLETISSVSVSAAWRKSPAPPEHSHLSGAVERDEVTTESPFLQAKHPQLPQLFLTGFMFQAPHQPRCLLWTIKHLNIPPKLRGPKSDYTEEEIILI